MGRFPIPWSSIDRYAGAAGLEGDSRERFRLLIRAIDNAWLEYARDRDERESKR